MPSPEADAIVRDVLSGQTEAYAGLVRLYQREVWGVAAALLHDAHRTEELVQQAFVEAYLHLDRYEPGRDFGAWIKSIARNLVREDLRARSRENRRMRAYREHLEARFRDDAAAERYETRLAEAHARCREVLAGPSARALDLRYGQSRSFEEIAADLGRSVEAVRQMLFRVRLALRDCIEKRMAQA